MNKARLKCFILFVLAVIEQCTVSLQSLSLSGSSFVKTASLYRRFQRFLAGHVFGMEEVGRLVLALLPRPGKGWVLAMDRTNWKFGKTHINILVITVVVGKMGFPVSWMLLPTATKCGNSKQSHRIKLMERLLATVMGAEEIRVLTLDREFEGKHWLGWLNDKGIGYIVRVKKSANIGAFKACWLCHYNCWRRQAETLHDVFGQQVYFTSKKITKGRDPHLAVISNHFNGQEALELYRLRWGIESFFSHLKKRGFQFEDTHLTKKPGIERLVAVLAVAFTMCYRWGETKEARTGKKLKKHGYRAKSLFRQGLEALHRAVKRPVMFADELREFIWLILYKPLVEKIVV